MLSAHSRLDCGPESRFFARFRHLDARARRATLDPATWPGPAVDFIGSLRNQGHPVVELFGLDLRAVREYLASRPPSLAAMLESLTVLHARGAGKARWLEKTPRHLLMTDLLRQLWPEARIVRIVRDPRDVALSLAGLPFAKESVVGNLVRVDQDDRASRDRIAADPLAMTLRYEDLVTEPERELRRICAFVGEEYEPAMLDSRASASAVAAEHEWWKAAVSGPLDHPERRSLAARDVRRCAALRRAPPGRLPAGARLRGRPGCRARGGRRAGRGRGGSEQRAPAPRAGAPLDGRAAAAPGDAPGAPRSSRSWSSWACAGSSNPAVGSPSADESS